MNDEVTLVLSKDVAKELEGWLEDDAEELCQEEGNWIHDSRLEWLPPLVAQVLLQVYDALEWQHVSDTTRARINSGVTKWSEHHRQTQLYKEGSRGTASR